MTIYVVFNQTIFPVGEFVLDRKLTISQQPVWENKAPILRGDEIFLPRYHDMQELIGSPHATIEPLSDTTVRYIQTFDPEKHQEIVFPPNNRMPIQIGVPYELNTEASPVIQIGEIFGLRVSPAPVFDEWWTDFHNPVQVDK